MTRPKNWNPERMNRRAAPYLDDFERRVASTDAVGRLAALLALAQVRVHLVNRDVHRHLRWRTRLHQPAGVGPCWVCERTAARVSHHVLQLQYGGTNARRNQVPICAGCHSHVHPHLSMPANADESLALAARRRSSLDARPRLVKTPKKQEV